MTRDPLVLLALAMAVAIRLVALDATGFNADEAYSSWVVADATRFATQIPFDSHPPLWYALLALWTRAAGDGDIAVRALSVIAGLLTVLLAARLARRLFGPLAARWAAGLAAVWPLLVASQRDSRMYAWLPVAALAAALALGRLERKRDVAVAGLALATLASVHYAGAFVAAALVLGAVASTPGRWRELASSAAVALVAWIPAALVLRSQLLNGVAAPSRGIGPGAILLVDTGITVGEPGDTGYWLIGALVVGALVTAAIAAGAARGGAYRPTFAALGLIGVVLPIALSATALALPLAPRFFIGVVPFAIIALSSHAAASRANAVATAAIALALVASNATAAFTGDRRANDWRGLAQLVAERTTDEPEVAIAPSYFAIAFERYYHGAARGNVPVRTVQRSRTVVEPPPGDAETAAFAETARGWLLLPSWLVDATRPRTIQVVARDEVIPTGWWMRAFMADRR